MKLSLNTLGCPDWTLEQIAQNAKSFGYEGIELRTREDGNHFSPDASLDEARRVGQMFRDAGCPVLSIMGYCKFAHTDDAEIVKNQELMRKLINIADAMGARYIRTFAGQIPKESNHDEMTIRVAKALKPLAEEAAAKNITIGLETHDDWCSGDRVMKVVKIIKSKGFGVVYDIHNAYNSGIEPWDVTYRKVKKHICYCHLKDGYKGLDGKTHYVMVGAGDLPVEKILARFKRDGFDSYFSFEWEKKWHAELEGPERVMPHFTHKVRAIWNAIPEKKEKTVLEAVGV
ncbi:MAG TPA: sugar phosphate isomerase/epimerase family protein [Planctomycetota bacterium]|nr:sugar phosphate isomerase/epimerase family protein [Planctomycetota bacterium]